MLQEINKIKYLLDSEDIPNQINIQLSRFSYFKMGGKILLLILPKSTTEIAIAIKHMKYNNTYPLIIGATSNILFSDQAIVPVCLTLKNLRKIEFPDNDTCRVEAGCMLPHLVKTLSERGIEGFEGLEGIPGTVGGAIAMNAGAFGATISDHLLHVDVIDPHGNLVRYSKHELAYSYRESRFKHETIGVITHGTFSLQKGDINTIKNKIEAIRKTRRITQENKLPNLGSTFATIDILETIGKYHKIYGLLYKYCSMPTRIIDKMIRLLTKKSHDSVWNKFTCYYFSIDCKNGRPYSAKTMNTIINNNYKSDKTFRYIEKISELTNGEAKLEIKIIK